VHVVLLRDVADDAVAAGDLARDASDAAGVAGDEGDASPRAANASTRARPRPDVPPVTATRSGVLEGWECVIMGPIWSDGAKVGFAFAPGQRDVRPIGRESR
jgi:hypothetical protein